MENATRRIIYGEVRTGENTETGRQVDDPRQQERPGMVPIYRVGSTEPVGWEKKPAPPTTMQVLEDISRSLRGIAVEMEAVRRAIERLGSTLT